MQRRQIVGFCLAIATLAAAIGLCFGDRIGDEFQLCCKEKGVSCKEVCTYPPPDFDIFQQWCMVSWSAEFIKCYTGGHNNTQCCEEHGVKGLYGICQDFCDGTQDHGWDPRYMVCGPMKQIISNCNYNSMGPRG